eukprot:CAMPEP_0196591372 /NCGR_PEP_ID=MMETSP1081-20130531/69374_1 /TAXON_ID=36882 /ORGANISM="Pyramimonas amylifera, Strain CCMP720" /LENGTH=109 /DNA_ID=CAMNT_0041914715 /DNA_START=104 /DNA_END=430 /DNA_ORIENTATION=-
MSLIKIGANWMPNHTTSHCSSFTSRRLVAPTEIRLRQSKILEVDFVDGFKASFPAELLRVESPSAQRGAIGNQVVSGRKYVGIISVEPVGSYAIRINFDDLHNTGIFTW